MQQSTSFQAQASSTPSVPPTSSIHAADVRDPSATGLPAVGYVRLPVVAEVCGIAKSTVWKWVGTGQFPKPVKLSSRVSAWQVDVIRTWLADPTGWQAANKGGVQ